MRKSTRFSSKRLLIALVLIVLAVAVLIVLERTGVIDIFPNKNNSSQDQQAETTSKQPSAQRDFTTSKSREVVPSANKDEGYVTDNKGAASTSYPKSQWSQSTSRVVTVYNPAKGAVLKSGDTIAGEAKADKVSFRLMDNVSGVISQGTISVSSGKYSGVFNFSTTGTEGRLDVFTTDADGIESNVVEIPVRFGQ